MPAYKSNVNSKQIKEAYERGFKSVDIGYANDYCEKSQIALYCAFEGGVSDCKAGYELNLNGFK